MHAHNFISYFTISFMKIDNGIWRLVSVLVERFLNVFFLAFHPSVSTNTQTNDFYKLQTDIPRDSDMVENFTCTQTMIQRYKLSLLRPSIKPLSASQKVSVRTDERGFLCLQFMIKTEDNHICFVEFFVSIIIIM